MGLQSKMGNLFFEYSLAKKGTFVKSIQVKYIDNGIYKPKNNDNKVGGNKKRWLSWQIKILLLKECLIEAILLP